MQPEQKGPEGPEVPEETKGIEGTYEVFAGETPETLNFVLLQDSQGNYSDLLTFPKDGQSGLLHTSVEQTRNRIFPEGPRGKMLETELQTGEPMTRMTIKNFVSIDPKGEIIKRKPISPGPTVIKERTDDGAI